MATKRRKPVTAQDCIGELEQKLDYYLEHFRLITVSEAQDIRGVTRAAIMSLIERGRLRAVKGFGRTWIYKDEIEKFMPEKPGPKTEQDDADAAEGAG